jgi:hypothetical protein
MWHHCMNLWFHTLDKLGWTLPYFGWLWTLNSFIGSHFCGKVLDKGLRKWDKCDIWDKSSFPVMQDVQIEWNATVLQSIAIFTLEEGGLKDLQYWIHTFIYFSKDIPCSNLEICIQWCLVWGAKQLCWCQMHSDKLHHDTTQPQTKKENSVIHYST